MLSVRFTPGYHKMTYPWGDIPVHLATAPDLVIRCARATGLDLQQLVHMDRVREPSRYPLRIWANRRPDRSIDHRRLPNLYTFIKAYLPPLPVYTDSAEKLASFHPGDLVFWVAPGGGDYPGLVGIVTDRDIKRALPSPLSPSAAGEYDEIVDSTSVDRVMTREPFTVASGSSLIEAAHQMSERKVGGLPVVNGDELVGMFTMSDAIRALLKLVAEA